MNICMITVEFPPTPGGIGSYVYNLSKKLIQKGNQVTVITRGSLKQKRLETDGIEIFELPFLPIYPLHVWLHGMYVKRLVKQLESNFNLIHVHSPIACSISSSLPVLTTVHTNSKVDASYSEVIDFISFADKLQSTFIYPPIESKLIQDSNMVTTVSKAAVPEVSKYRENGEDIAVLGNGVDEKVFFPVKIKSNEKKYVLYTGVLRARKGLFDLLQCAKYVCSKHPDIKFVICGKGRFLNKVNQEIGRLNLQENVELLGYVSKSRLVELYQNALLQLIPSHYEGLPTVLLEGMSCGLPIVATNISGNNEVIASGVNGILVPSKNPEELAKVVLTLLNDKPLRKKIGVAARKTIEDFYTWDKVADRFLEQYQKIV